MKFSFNLKVKRYFVYKYYGRDIDVISTRNKELKVDAVKIISKVNNCNLNEILFVDDIKDIKIDRRKLSNERVLDLLAKVENPYVFKINAHLIQIGFTNNGKTAEDCLTNVLE